MLRILRRLLSFTFAQHGRASGAPVVAPPSEPASFPRMTLKDKLGFTCVEHFPAGGVPAFVEVGPPPDTTCPSPYSPR